MLFKTRKHISRPGNKLIILKKITSHCCQKPETKRFSSNRMVKWVLIERDTTFLQHEGQMQQEPHSLFPCYSRQENIFHILLTSYYILGRAREQNFRRHNTAHLKKRGMVPDVTHIVDLVLGFNFKINRAHGLSL